MFKTEFDYYLSFVRVTTAHSHTPIRIRNMYLIDARSFFILLPFFFFSLTMLYAAASRPSITKPHAMTTSFFLHIFLSNILQLNYIRGFVYTRTALGGGVTLLALLALFH